MLHKYTDSLIYEEDGLANDCHPKDKEAKAQVQVKRKIHLAMNSHQKRMTNPIFLSSDEKAYRESTAAIKPSFGTFKSKGLKNLIDAPTAAINSLTNSRQAKSRYTTTTVDPLKQATSNGQSSE